MENNSPGESLAFCISYSQKFADFLSNCESKYVPRLRYDQNLTRILNTSYYCIPKFASIFGTSKFKLI